MPDGQQDTGCPVNFEKENETVESCIEIGKKGETIYVSKPVRIVLSGEGNNTPYTVTHDNEERTIIETQCSSDLVDTIASQIGGEGQPDMCYIKVGTDMVIWTSHFTAFGTISIPITTTTESVSSSSSWLSMDTLSSITQTSSSLLVQGQCF